MLQRRQWHPTPVLLPGKPHGPRSLVGCSRWGRWESDTTERLHFHFSLSCIGEGNGNPLQCSCLENPRDGGAWWAAVYGVAQSRTRLKRLSSSSRGSSLVAKSCLTLATPQTVACQVPWSVGLSRQEYWSELPFPSPMHESEKWKWSLSVVSAPQRPHGLQPSRLLHPWDFPGKSTGVGCYYEGVIFFVCG